MSKFYFVIQGPDKVLYDDRYGTEFLGRAEAVSYGKRIIRELKDAGGYDGPEWVLLIKNESGQLIALLRFEAPNSADS